MNNDYWIYKNDGKEIPCSDGAIGTCDVCDAIQEKVVVIGHNRWPDYDISSMFVCRECVIKIYNDKRWE